MTVTTCAHVRLALGVYVLGSIDPADRPAVEEHLAQCPSCRDELASLAGIPGLLGRLEEPEVVGLADPPDSAGQLLNRTLRAAAAHRRSRRRRVLLRAAALVLLLTGIGAGAKVLTSGNNTSAPATVSLTSTAGPLSVRAGLTARAWGTSVDLRLSGVPGGYRCRVVAVSRDGGTDTAASYTSTYAGSMLVSGATALQLAEITELRIIDTSGRTLVSMPR